MTDELIQPPLMETIKKFLIQADENQQIFLYVPYIKTNVLSKLVDKIKNVTIITTWHMNDLLGGSSELELYPFCKDHNYKLYVNNKVHLKVYSIALDTAIVATGNISKAGLEGKNEECGVLVKELSSSDRSFLEKIKTDATLIDESEYQRHLERYEELSREIPDKVEYDDLIVEKEREYFLKSELPMTRNVNDLIKGYGNIKLGLKASENEVIDACIHHDLQTYHIELNLSDEEFLEKLKKNFFEHPFVQKIDELLEPEAYWGTVRRWIRDHCKDVPLPKAWDLTENTQTVYDWFVKLGDGKYNFDQPNHSQRLYKVDDILKYENEVLQILNEPGLTIEQIKKKYSKLPNHTLHDQPTDSSEQENTSKSDWHYKDEIDTEIEKRLSLSEEEVGERNSKGKLYNEIVDVIIKLHDDKLIKFWYYKKNLIRGVKSDGVWKITEKGKQEIQRRGISYTKETSTITTENPILEFERGQFYHHDEIWKPLKLGFSGGIRTSVKNKLVILFWNARSEESQKERNVSSGRTNIYEDSFENGLYRYIGFGQEKEKNQKLTHGNKAIVQAKEMGRTIHMFHQHEINGKHEYCGEVELVGKPETQTNEKMDREEFVFFLKPVELQYEKNDESDKQTKLENSRLVLFSVAGEAAFEHYENTILKDVSTNNFQTSEMKKLPNVRMWGANDRSTNHNRSKWSKLKKGDILLFYKDKKYVAQMTISGTEDNYDVAKMIWGEKIDHDTMNVESKSGETWQLIMYAEPDNVKQTDVKMGDLNNLLDYKENFMPTRTLDFMPVNESKLQQLQNQYGSIQNALDSIDL